MHKLTLTALAEGMKKRQFSSRELTTHFLDRIRQHQDLNAFITIDAEKALQQADRIDHQSDAENSPLAGIPVAHKDIFCTEGILTSCGSKILSNFIAPYNATVIENFNRHGAIILGKTNMDEFAMGSSNESSWYGPVKNPWNTGYVPGGSSGGSAAAVAAKLAPAATGTDTGGSVRQPAALCGITGLKPSYGRISRYGMIAFASSFDQAGVLSQNAEDAAIMLQTMAGFDARDSTSLQQPVPDFSARLSDSLAGLCIGVAKEYFAHGIEDTVANAVQNALRVFETLGAKIVDIELPNSELSIPCYYVLAPAEASSNLSRFDGVRYGYRTEQYDDLMDMYQRTRSEGFGAEVKRRIMVGTYALSSGYYDAYYIKAQKLRRLIARDFEQAFQHCDIIIGPTTPGTAFPLGAKTSDPVAMYLNDIYTTSVNLAGLPAMSIPAGLGENKLPIGLHMISPYLEEARLLNVAHQFQMNTDHHQLTPGGF